MFSMIPNPFFNVTLSIGSPGRQLSILFRHMTRTQFYEWQRRAVEISAMPAGEERNHAEAMWLAESIKGWGTPNHPVDEAGTGVPYSLEALKQILDAFPSSGAALFAAYERALFNNN